MARQRSRKERKALATRLRRVHAKIASKNAVYRRALAFQKIADIEKTLRAGATDGR